MLTRRAGLLLLMLGCVVLPWMSFNVPVTYAQARGQAITVRARSSVVHFPGSIDFYETVNDSTSSLQQASLTLNIGPQQDQELQNVSVPQGQRTATLHWHEDTSGTHFLPAGVQISYYWQIWDTTGNTLTDTTQSLTTTDTRFQWQHLNHGLLQVNWYGHDQSFGQMLLSKSGTSLDHIGTILGSGLRHPINLWVYSSDTDFHGSLEPGAYEWVGGEALPDLHEASIVVTDASSYTLVRDMPHELTHLVFHQLIERGITPPTWFDEGLAVYNQIYHEPDMLARFNQALSTNSLLRLDDISLNFPADSDKAYLAYAQSWQLLTYMYKTFGQAKMIKLIQNLDDAGNDFDTALQKSIGEDHLHLENQWRLALHQPGVLSPDELTPTPNTSGTSPSSTGATRSGNNTALWIFGGLGLIILLEGCVMVIWLTMRKRRRAAAQSAQPVYPTYPASWNQVPALPAMPPGNWPAGYPQSIPPAGYYQGASYPPRPEEYAQVPVPGSYPPPRPGEYVQAPVTWRVPQE
ncbi:MAG: peptidase MA family metallohydrolase [Ktedonobacteraceae bacterium]